MNRLVTAIQILLGIVFLLIGCMKLFTPVATLAGSLDWVYLFPEFIVRLIGGAELLAGLALIGPLLLKRMHRLSAFASLGLMLIMVLATLLHLSRPGEQGMAIVNVVIFALAAIVMVSRFRTPATKAIES